MHGSDCPSRSACDTSPLIPSRVTAENDWRILTPLLARDDCGWMGFGGRRVKNWDPWIASNWIASALLWEVDAQRRPLSSSA